MTRAEARVAGLKNYRPDRPCRRGHFERRVSNDQCTECYALWVRANKEHCLEQGRIYYHATKEARKPLMYAYGKANRAKITARAAAWKKANPERRKEMDAAYRERNREKVRAINSAYEKANRAKVTARKKKRRQEDLARVQARDAAYRKREAVRYQAHWAAWRAALDNATVADLPEGWDRAIYAEAKRQGLSVDHIIPLRPCRGCGRKGTHEPSNLQLLSRPDNSSKGQRCQECWDIWRASPEGGVSGPQVVGLEDGWVRWSVSGAQTVGLVGGAA